VAGADDVICKVAKERPAGVGSDLMQHLQPPLMSLVTGEGDRDAVARGRHGAAQAIVGGYETAIMALDPSDAEELAWYRERLLDARLGAAHACAELQPHASSLPPR
jgi:hypothetical protein